MPELTSSVRSTLENCLKNRARISPQLEHVAERTKEFHAADRERFLAAQRLDRFVTSEAAAVTAWSKGDTGAVPSAKDRQTLEAELRTARAKADDARTIAAPFLAAGASLHNQKGQADLDVRVAIAHVLLEAIDPEISELEANARQFYRKVIEVDQAVDFISGMARDIGKLDTTNPDVDTVRSILLDLEKVRERTTMAVDRWRAPAVTSNIVSRLTALVAALDLNAAARLGAA